MIFNTNAWRRVVYTLAAPVYDALVAVFKRRRRRSIRLANLQPGERVLLVGAGTGPDLVYLPPGVTITAIDLVPAMVKRLRRRARRLSLAVDARVMDGQALAFPDASFDVVILHLIVAVIPDPYACMREAARVLRPGGRAVIFDKFAPDNRRVPLVLRLANPISSFIATDITRQLGPLLAAAGLRAIHEEPAGLWGLLKIVVAQKD